MASEEILLKYKADISDLQSKLIAIEVALKKLGGAGEEPLKRQIGLIENARNKYAALQAAREKNNDPTKIVRYNELLDKQKANLDKLTGAQKDLGKGTDFFSNQLKSLGSAVVGAFAVERVIAFGEAAFHAFAEAELTAKKLQVAVGVSGGLSKDFESLIEQSKELESISIFSDDDIQKAQTMALQFGLTAKQVEELTPVIADFASATGQSISEATQAVLRGLEGQGRGLKLYGVNVDATKSKTENLKLITDQLTESFSGQAEIVGKTSFGAIEKLKNAFNNFQEDVGQFIVDAGEATAAIVGWIANGFKPLDDAADESAAHLASVSEAAKSLAKNADALSLAGLKAELDSLVARGAPGEAIDALNEQIKKLSLRQFENEISSLDINQLKAKLKQVEDQAKKTTFAIVGKGDVKTQEKKDLIEAQIKALEKQQAILDEQGKGKGDDSAAKKAAEDEQKRLEDAAKAQEALRQFTLKSLQDNADEANTIRKKDIAESITDEEDRNLAFLESDKQALEEQKKNLIDFAESTNDIENKILANKIAIASQTGKITKAFLDDTLKDIDQNAKDQIEVLSKVKDDPSTKIDEEKEAQHKILDIRKQAVGQSIFLLEQLRDLGVITEQQYTDAVDKLAQDRKLIRQDEINQGLKDDEDAKQKRLKTIQDLQAAYEQLSGAIKEGTDAIFNNQIESLQAQDQANKDFFDKQQEDINNNVEKRLITEGQGERKSAKLKEERAASEKKSNEAVKALKRQQAEIDKGLTIFRLTLQLLEALAQFPPNPFAIAAASVSLGTAIATPVPKFKAGASWVERGRNAMGEDTIPAMLDEGERVVSRTKNIKHWDIYEAIDQGRLNQYVMKNFVTPALKSQQKTFEENKQKTFADNVGQSLIYNGLTYHEADRIRRKGTRITNEESLAKSVAKEIAKEMNAQKYLG